MNKENIKEQIAAIDDKLFALDELVSTYDDIDIHRYYEMEAKLVTEKKLLLNSISEYELLTGY